MDNKERVLQLKHILNTVDLTAEQRKDIERAIIILETYRTIDKVIEVLRIITPILTAAISSHLIK
jgi:hypothetical protein